MKNIYGIYFIYNKKCKYVFNISRFQWKLGNILTVKYKGNSCNINTKCINIFLYPLHIYFENN